MRNTILFTAALLASISAIAASAQAQTSRVVNHDGLDLGTPAGRAALDRRIAVAVETVCGSYAGVSAEEAREIDRCRAAARSGIQTQLAALAARHARISYGAR